MSEALLRLPIDQRVIVISGVIWAALALPEMVGDAPPIAAVNAASMAIYCTYRRVYADERP